MRTGLLTVAAILVGSSIGLSVTWLEFRGMDEHFQYISRTKVGTEPGAVDTTPPLAVVVGGKRFDFGVLNQDQTHEKTFVIRNDGGRPLSVAWGGQSCGMCIENKHNFTRTSVPPGGTCEVTVTYSTRKPGPRFSESAYLTTNDPENASLHLEITGDVVKAVRLEPESLALSSILASESTTASVNVIGYLSDRLELIGHEFSNPSLAPLLEMTSKPLDEATLKKIEHARAGIELRFQIKPGLPLGPLSQNVTLKIRTDNELTLDLPIRGTVVGDLSIIGKNVNSAQSSFSLGLIPTETGRSAEIFVLVKGPHRNDVKLTVGTVDPPEMQVSVGEPIPLADGKIMKHPVQIGIAKGTSRMSRLGNSQGEAGRVVLQTTHPYSKELPIEVRFAVE